MQIVESNILVSLNSALSVYETKVLLKLVQFGQEKFKGKPLQAFLKRNEWQDKPLTCEFKLCEILPENSHHHEDVVKAVRSLQSRVLTYALQNIGQEYSSSPILESYYKTNSGIMRLKISVPFMAALYDLTYGFKIYTLDNALKLKSTNAIKFYKLLCHQPPSKPLKMRIDRLRSYFGVANKYAQTADFIKKIVEPSRLQLNKCGCNSFTYSRIREGRQVVGIIFFPVCHEKTEPLQELSVEDLDRKKAIKMYMREYMDFTIQEINSNDRTINAFSRIPIALEELQHIDHLRKKSMKGKGYIIKSMRNIVQEFPAKLKD